MIYSPLDKSVSVKIIDNRLMDEIPFYRVEKMVDTSIPEDIDSLIRRVSIWDSQENNRNGISVCVTHRYGDNHICFPENVPNSKTSPPAFCALVNVVTEREDIGPVDRMVMLDIINEGENISNSSNKFSPESILTGQHKLSHTIRRTSPNRNTILKGCKNIYRKSGCLVIYSPLDKSVSVKIINHRLMDEIFFYRVEKMVDMRKPKENDSLTRVKCMRNT